MQKKTAFALTALMVLALVGFACGGGEAEPTARPPTSAPQPTAVSSAPSGGGDVVKVVNRDQGGSGEYKFVPSEYTFEVGETVTFEMSGETEFHTFTVEELDIDESVDGGQIVRFEVTFDKAGTFELICIPHEAFGMVGTITVK